MQEYVICLLCKRCWKYNVGFTAAMCFCDLVCRYSRSQTWSHSMIVSIVNFCLKHVYSHWSVDIPCKNWAVQHGAANLSATWTNLSHKRKSLKSFILRRLSPKLRDEAYSQLRDRAVHIIGDTPKGRSRAEARHFGDMDDELRPMCDFLSDFGRCWNMLESPRLKSEPGWTSTAPRSGWPWTICLWNFLRNTWWERILSQGFAAASSDSPWKVRSLIGFGDFTRHFLGTDNQTLKHLTHLKSEEDNIRLN